MVQKSRSGGSGYGKKKVLEKFGKIMVEAEKEMIWYGFKVC